MNERAVVESSAEVVGEPYRFVAMIKSDQISKPRLMLLGERDPKSADREIHRWGAAIGRSKKFTYLLAKVSAESYVALGKKLIDKDLKVPGSILRDVPELGAYARNHFSAS